MASSGAGWQPSPSPARLGSIIHPKNYYAWNYTLLLGLPPEVPSHSDDSLSLGIWNGHEFVYKTLNCNSKLPIVQRLVSIANSIIMALRYGVVSLFRMNSFIEFDIKMYGIMACRSVNKFLRYYDGLESRSVFESVEAMLKWAGLFNLTTITLGEKLEEVGLSPILVEELVTVITRINYGQSVNISGLAGGVSLAGSGGGLWAVEGGLADGCWINQPFGYVNHISRLMICSDQAYFGLDLVSDIPELIDALLDKMFSVRVETVRIDWAAYPHFHTPETYAPFILDGKHLYYVNAFENAASTMETSAVAAENIARLIFSRIVEESESTSPSLKIFSSDSSVSGLRSEL
ncbi:hypothetical protein SASPL_140022 [Salvia splendens]|uniref:Prenylcysteine lyase domain-containing protein n=1 Tax=Salvia splendens TaxID=180675 RepID=A0A8X8WPM9_SALSN|nr:hypothetical protein SASPL_140022 [Salvia splendens]